MKRTTILLLLVLLIAPAAFAQDSLGGGLFGSPGRIRRSTFANLSTPPADSVRYCTDCLATGPCTGGGSGAFAFRVGSAWNCVSGAGGGSGVSSSTDNAFPRFDGTAGALQNGILTSADWNGDLAGPSALTTTTSAGLEFTNQPANDGVEIVSSNAADTTQTWTIIGTTNGSDTVVVETGTLNGTTFVPTVKVDWGVILAVKLSASAAGTVTVREASGDATITTLLTTVVAKGVEAVSAANQSAWNRTVLLVASGATTKQLGLKGTNSSGTVIYDSQALNGATAVLSNSTFATVTEIYTGDLEAARTATQTATKGTKLDGLYIATTPSSLCSAGDFVTSTAGNGLLTCGTPAGGITATAGSGTELQIRAGASTLGAVTGSSSALGGINLVSQTGLPAADGTTSVFKITSTFPQFTSTAVGPGVLETFTPTNAGTVEAQAHVIYYDLNGAYLQSGPSQAFNVYNGSRTTNSTWPEGGTRGGATAGHFYSNGGSTGNHFGIVSQGAGSGASSYAVGVIGQSTSTTENQIGVVGQALSGTNNVGVYGGLNKTEPTLTNAAAIFDNGAVAAPILILRDNGAEVGGFQDGGGLTALTVVEANTGTKTPTAAETREHYTNTGDADGSQVTLLNDPTIGVTYSVSLTVAQTVTIVTSAGETLYMGADQCVASMTASGIGAYATVRSVTSGSGAQWHTVASSGFTCND